MEPNDSTPPQEERVSLREKNMNVVDEKYSFQKSAHANLKRHSSASPASRLKTQKSVADPSDTTASSRRSTAFEIRKPHLTKSRSSSPNLPRKNIFSRSPSKNDSGKYSSMAKVVASNSMKMSRFRMSRSISDSSEDVVPKPSNRRTNSEHKLKHEENEIINQSMQFLHVHNKGGFKFNSLMRKKSGSLNPRRLSETESRSDRFLRQLSKRKKHKRISLPDYRPEDIQRRKTELTQKELELLQNRRREEITVFLSITEAKDVPDNKSYHCLVFIVGETEPVYKTSTQVKENNVLMWGENTDFSVTEASVRLRIELRKCSEGRIKEVGHVTTDHMVPSLTSPCERWLRLETGKAERTPPSIRVKYRLEKVDVLPLSKYKQLRTVIKDSAAEICEKLEPILTSVKQKKEVANIFVNIMQCEGKATPFLNSLMLQHVKTIGDNEAVLFRGNSIGSAAMEAYMRLVGFEYLKNTLLPTINNLIVDHPAIELSDQNEKKINETELHKHVDHIWTSIRDSTNSFPLELRCVFYSLREHLKDRDHLTNRLISSSVFLRFLCAATMSPSLFDLIPALPREKSRRSLTLVTKVLQTMANFTTFQSKESYMECLNGFIKNKEHEVRAFLANISKAMPQRIEIEEYKGCIDIAKQLAMLQLKLHPVLLKSEHKDNIDLHRLIEALKYVDNELLPRPRPSPSVQRQQSTPAMLKDRIPSRYTPASCCGLSLPYHTPDRSHSITSNASISAFHQKLARQCSPSASSITSSNDEAFVNSENLDQIWCKEPLMDDVRSTEDGKETMADTTNVLSSTDVVILPHHRSGSSMSLSSSPTPGDKMRSDFIASHSPKDSSFARKAASSDKLDSEVQSEQQTDDKVDETQFRNLQKENEEYKKAISDLLAVIKGITSRNPEVLSAEENRRIKDIIETKYLK